MDDNMITEDEIKNLVEQYLTNRMNTTEDLVAMLNLLQLNSNIRLDTIIDSIVDTNNKNNKNNDNGKNNDIVYETINEKIDKLIELLNTKLNEPIVTYSDSQKYVGTFKGTEGYALTNADIDEIVNVMIGDKAITGIAKEVISKHEKVVLISGTDSEPYVIPAVKGIRMNKNQVMSSLEIRDLSTYISNITDCVDFSVVTIYIANSLDQTLTIQVKGNVEDSKSGAVNIGSTFTVASNDYEARTLEPTDEGWLPYIYFTVVASTEPSSGNVTGTILRRN